MSKKVGFHQASWLSGKVTDQPDDILLGHPTWDARNAAQISNMGKLQRNWIVDNALSSNASSHPNTYILMPWVPEFPSAWTLHMPFYEQQLESASKIFALCGDFWIQKTLEKVDSSIQSKVKDKLIHCNMGVAAQNFNIIKKNFNAVGERQILHMSNLADYKGFDVTCKSLDNLETLLHVATGSLPDQDVGLLEIEIDGNSFVFNHIGFVDNSSDEFNSWVVENCDFYIHTGLMDAQATTILENCARGLVPLITPESGFSSPHAIYLTHDPDKNREIIENALNLPESDLMKRSQLVREQVLKENCWEKYLKLFGTRFKMILLQEIIFLDYLIFIYELFQLDCNSVLKLK